MLKQRAARWSVAGGLVVALALGARPAHADGPPRLLSAPEVTAPADVPRNASAVLVLTLDATGTVTDVELAQGVRPDIDAQVLEAARAMRFAPAERGGVNVPARVRFRFRLRATQPGSAATPTTGSPPDAPAGTPRESLGPGAPSTPGITPASSGSAPPAATTSLPENPFVTRPGPGAAESGVTVRGHYEPGAATRMSFRAEELTTVPGTFGEPTRIVASQPGVARTPFGLGYFVVRGASFENTGFFIDGYPVLILYHLALGPAVISSRLVGQLDFYPGGYPAQFGRLSAGVISLETRAPPTDRPRLEAEIDFFRASLLGVVPFDHGRGSIALAVRRSYYDLMLPLLSPGVSVNYGDAQLRADYRLSDRVRTSLFVFGSQDLFDRTEVTGQGASTGESRDALQYNWARAIARIEYSDPRGVSAQLSGMLGWDDSFVVQSDPGRPDRGLRAGGAVLGQRASVRVPVSPAFTTTLGIDNIAYLYDVALSYPSPAGFGSVPMPQSNPRIANINAGVTQFGVAPYIESVVRGGPLEFTGALRLDFVGYAGRNYTLTDPRAVARYRADRRVTFVASSGLFHQPPPVFALVPQAGSQDLLPQRAWQSSLGVELTLPLDLEARVTGFFNRMWQLPRATYETIDTPTGPRTALAVSDGEGRAYGLEVQLRRRLERGIYGWVSYTLSRSERFIGDGRVVPFTYDQTHVLNMAASWEITEQLRAGVRFSLATGSPTNAVSGGIYDADADGFRPQYTSEADRLPTYHQLDVRVDYRFRYGPLRMSAYLDVLNAYYAQNSEGWVYQYDYLARRPRPGIPILPTLGIRGEL